MNESILVVEDEVEIADLLRLYLENEGYRVRCSHTAPGAREAVDAEAPDLAILDLMLPGGSGLELCQYIRQKHHFPILMLTAKDGETDKITGLTVGADDYITKPFRPLEVVARVKAQLRRYTRYNPAGQAADTTLSYRGLVLDIPSHTCTLNDRELQLTPTEFSILRILFEKRGSVVGSEELFHALWGEEYYNKNSNTISVHIRHIREKLGDTADRPRFIKTVWGVGYKIEA